MDSTRKIGFFGGSFDPVHCGHVSVAQDAFEQLGLDRLIFVPAAVPPHKLDWALSSGDDRLEMLRLAAAVNPCFEVSDLELRRGGVSFTVDTMSEIRAMNPAAQLFFIIGLDSLAELHLWFRIDDLLELCTVVPFARGGESVDEVAKKIKLPAVWKERLLSRVIQLHEIEISSSEIRRRAGAGLSISGLVPPPVELYIARRNLYQRGKI